MSPRTSSSRQSAPAARPLTRGGWVPRRRAVPLTRAHVLSVAAVLLVALLAACVWWWVSQARPAPVATVLARGTPVPTGSSTPSATTSVVVHVLGKVRRQGLVRLASDARVADAIEAAGGALPGTRLELNLARLLVDGEQVLVGVDPPPGSPAAGTTAGGPLNLNTATVEQLDTLPGVGPVLAARIVEWRTAHGRFSTVDELREVSGVGEKRFSELAALVRV